MSTAEVKLSFNYYDGTKAMQHKQSLCMQLIKLGSVLPALLLTILNSSHSYTQFYDVISLNSLEVLILQGCCTLYKSWTINRIQMDTTKF